MKINFKFSKIIALVAIATAFASCTSSSREEGDNDQPGKNLFLADPTIFFHDGTYYLYGTGSKKGFPVYISTDLKTWKKPAPEEAPHGLALNKEEAFGTRGFWAPQIFVYKGKFYMAYTANENIAIAKSDSPVGPFTQEEKAPLEAPVKQIDPFVFIDDDGKKYLYHVRVANGGNKIFVAEMNDDLSGIKHETLTACITATTKWENTEDAKWSVTEGPSVIKRNNLYYLVYSANHFRSKDYAVGYAVSDSPYGPWEKYEGNPILSRHDVKQPGVGHGDFFWDSNDMYYVLHTHNSDSTVGPRKTAVIKASFSKGTAGLKEQLGMDAKSFHYLLQK